LRWEYAVVVFSPTCFFSRHFACQGVRSYPHWKDFGLLGKTLSSDLAIDPSAILDVADETSIKKDMEMSPHKPLKAGFEASQVLYAFEDKFIKVCESSELSLKTLVNRPTRPVVLGQRTRRRRRCRRSTRWSSWTSRRRSRKMQESRS